MIRRLRVTGYKSLYDVELDTLTKLVLLYGPNASGKSNLLDALDLLGYLAREDTLTAAFQKHRGNRLGRALPVRWFFHGSEDTPDRRQEMTFSLDIDLHDSIREGLNTELKAREESQSLQRPYTRVTRTRLRYELALGYRHRDRALEITSESLLPLNQRGDVRTGEVPYIRHESVESRASVKLERQAHPRYFSLPRQRTLLSEIGDPVNHPHIVALARELASIRVYYVEPTRMRGEVSDIRAEDPGPHGEFLASFYYWLNTIIRFATKTYFTISNASCRASTVSTSGREVKDSWSFGFKKRGGASSTLRWFQRERSACFVCWELRPLQNRRQS